MATRIFFILGAGALVFLAIDPSARLRARNFLFFAGARSYPLLPRGGKEAMRG
jgi:hypothetical protein